ncbi:hypothetical protein [Octadecabacter sp. R77987]|uniref:hypothetical protein n=1 Tax=Octadecabacter sp. R77987 TaxID=3093874 RepID=UPI00366DC7F0
MTDNNERPDAYSGIPWVNVTPQQARALPQGNLGLILYLIIAYLIVTGLFKLWAFSAAGYPLGVIVLGAALPILTGLGLWARMPWAIIVAIIMAGFTLYAFARNVGTDPSFLLLADALVAVGMIFYLVEGDRPNLIYRHRYRKYSAVKDE